MMQDINHIQLVKQAMIAVLLSGITFSVSADQLQPRRTLPGAPTAPAPVTAIPTPRTLMPEIVADGGGMPISGKFAAFTNPTPVSVNSNVMTPGATAPVTCRFSGTFQLKNSGGGAAPMFDVYTMADSQHGVRSMYTGYSIPAMAAGASYSQSFQLDLAPDTYSVILTIDPYHKLKQATQDAKKYLVKIKTSCDGINSVLHGPATAGATGAAPARPGSTVMLNPQPLPPKLGNTGNAGLPSIQK